MLKRSKLQVDKFLVRQLTYFICGGDVPNRRGVSEQDSLFSVVQLPILAFRCIMDERLVVEFRVTVQLSPGSGWE